MIEAHNHIAGAERQIGCAPEGGEALLRIRKIWLLRTKEQV